MGKINKEEIPTINIDTDEKNNDTVSNNLPKKGGDVLLVCDYSENRGSGHLKRILTLLEKLGDDGCIYMSNSSLITKASLLGHKLDEDKIVRSPKVSDGYKLIIIDNFSTNKEELAFFQKIAPVMLLDEGGDSRKYATYLLDMLPMIKTKYFNYPNEQNVGYLDLPDFINERDNPPKKILVSFGGVDEAGLTEIIGNTLDLYELKNITWDVVKGGLVKRTFAWPGVKVIENVDLKNILHEYDLVITHFGLTAYEAISSGANVVLLNPSDYHQKLSLNAGFASLGIGKLSDEMQTKFYDYLTGKNIKQFKSNVDLGVKKDITDVINQLKNNLSKTYCPCCKDSDSLGLVIYRDKERNYVKCEICGLVYGEEFSNNKTVYNEQYFFEEYKAQYGKTYLEDFDHIKNLSNKRIKIIKKFYKKDSKVLLDIGCAYGAFLQSASLHGFDVNGIDVSSEAVAYVNETLELKAKKATLPDDDFGLEKIDVITMWYVIEHFKDVDKVMKKVSDALKEGGILAFSTPKGDGLSVKVNERKFYSESPKDHYIILSQINIKTFLKKYGFKLVYVKTTGVHVKRRFPNINVKSFKYKILTFVYTLMGQGDTFEVYAEKI